jgi:energy-coupling factor transporter ATP-binding protein EcfA2
LNKFWTACLKYDIHPANFHLPEGADVKLVPRFDLGGFATELPGIRNISGTEITAPFVLLHGPNGSGKTSLLKMLWGVHGLSGEGTGFRPMDLHENRLSGLDAAGGDVGRLALFEPELHGNPRIRRGSPGILDARELGWTGHRMYLLSTRSTTAAASQSHFNDHDFTAHLNQILASKAASHGQLLLRDWNRVLAWAGGLIDLPDPFDRTRPSSTGVNDYWTGAVLAHHDIYEALAGHPAGSPRRPAERWLLLDEPDMALDMPNFFAIMATLMAACETGGLRVFCASHSPLFAAGLANHPTVQVVDLAAGSFERTKTILSLASDIDAIGERGRAVLVGFRKAAEEADQRKPSATPKTARGASVPRKQGRGRVKSRKDAGET